MSAKCVKRLTWYIAGQCGLLAGYPRFADAWLKCNRTEQRWYWWHQFSKYSPGFKKCLGNLTYFPVLLPRVPNVKTGSTRKMHLLIWIQQVWLSAWRIWRQWQAAELSDRASGVMKSAWIPETKSVYKSPCGNYISCCVEKLIDLFQSLIVYVMGYADSMLNICRSAIPANHPQIDEVKVCKCPLSQQLM